MSDTITVKQVGLTEVKATPTGQVLKMTFPFTQKFAREFGWPEELPDITKKWSPDSPPVTANWVKFIPSDPSLAARAFKLECHGQMSNFEVIRKAAKGKNARKSGEKVTDVSLSVAFADEDLGTLVTYMRTTVKSAIQLSYDPTPVQTEMTGADDRQADLDGAKVEQPDPNAEDFTPEDERKLEENAEPPRKNP